MVVPASPGGGRSAAATPIHLLGTGPLAEELWAVAQDAGLEVAAFVENLDRTKAGGTLLGRPIVWVDDLPAGAACVCALSTTRRRGYVEQVADRATFPNLIHPSAVILPGANLGEGTVVSAGVIVAAHAVLGRHVFCNRGVRIGHHTRVGDFVTLQPGANLAGLDPGGPGGLRRHGGHRDRAAQHRRRGHGGRRRGGAPRRGPPQHGGRQPGGGEKGRGR